MILEYDLNTMEYLRRDAKFSREFCMGMPNSLLGGDTKNTEGVPKSRGDLTRGSKFSGVPDPL